MKITLPSTVEEYDHLAGYIESMYEHDRAQWRAWMRAYAAGSLYFLLSYVLLTRYATTPAGDSLTRNQWWLDRCNDVQFERNDVLDAWFREAGKSTIKTFGDNIRLMLVDPNVVICIFAITQDLAEAHLTIIRVELETNELLKTIFDDRLYWDPKKQSPKWGSKGLCIKRLIPRREQTFEASGFLYGVTPGKHFDVLDFDDCGNEETASSPEMMERSRTGFSAAANLCTRSAMFSYTGVFYSDGDLTRHWQDEGIVDRTRLFKAWDDELPRPDLVDIGGGEPRLLTAKELRQKKKRMGPEWFWLMMGMDPRASEHSLLDVTKIQRYAKSPYKAAQGGNIMLLCDGGGGKSNPKGTDPTAFMAIALQADKNFYVLDLVERPMNPSERIAFAISFHRKWSEWGPVKEFRWEETGTGSDVHHLLRQQSADNYRFRITRIPRGGAMKREGARVGRNRFYFLALEPILERLFVPEVLRREVRGKKNENIADHFVKAELGRFPVAKMDHLVSALVLLLEEPVKNATKHIPALIWPQSNRRRRNYLDPWDRKERAAAGGTWMSGGCGEVAAA